LRYVKSGLHALIAVCVVSVLFASSAFAASGPAAPAPAAPSTSGLTVPITGTTANGGAFNGTLNVTHFQAVNGQLQAVGTLSGTITDATGAVVGTVTNMPVTLPVAAASGTCQVLNLTLGPLDLNLLGLMVHLNQVVLNITAQSGPGNLLGNLLCGVAHLLDSNGSANGLAGLLNNLLRHL
jgi:hypothetical protein